MKTKSKAEEIPRPGFVARSDPGGGSQTMKEAGFYKSPAWRRVRRMALQRDGGLCRLNYPGCKRIANTVHHVQELERRPELALELDNLVSCCRYCHEQTKDRINNNKYIVVPSGVRVIKL